MSGSGQALEAAILTSALLLQHDQFATGLRNSLQLLVTTANRGGPVEPLESVFLDMLALGKRLDWNQLVELMKHVPDTNGLQNAAALFRDHEADLPVIYSAIYFSDSPAAVAKYVGYFPKTGLKDLRFGLRAGGDAVRQLLESQEPVHYPTIRERVVGWSLVRWIYEPLARVATAQPFSVS